MTSDRDSTSIFKPVVLIQSVDLAMCVYNSKNAYANIKSISTFLKIFFLALHLKYYVYMYTHTHTHTHTHS